MFGIIFSSLVGLAKTFVEIKQTYHDNYVRNKERKLKHVTYIDHVGALRLVQTNEYVYYKHINNDPKEDYVLCNSNGDTVINFSKSIRQKRNNVNMFLAIQNGNTVYEKGYSSNEKSVNKLYKVYVDFATGKEFICDRVMDKHEKKYVKYYRDIKSGEFIRKADCEILYQLDHNTDVNAMLSPTIKEKNKNLPSNESWKNYLERIGRNCLTNNVDFSVPNRQWLDDQFGEYSISKYGHNITNYKDIIYKAKQEGLI